MLMRPVVVASPVSKRSISLPAVFSMWIMIERCISGESRRLRLCPFAQASCQPWQQVRQMQHLGLVTRRELHRRFGLMLPDRALPFGDSVVSVGEGFHLFPLKKDRGKSENLSTSADLTDCQPEFGLTRSRSTGTSFANWVRYKAGGSARERNARLEFSLTRHVYV